MARRNYRKEIFGLLEIINKETGVNYMADYVPHYGGWSLYLLNSHGERSKGKYGFDYKISGKEMVQRLIGIISAL